MTIIAKSVLHRLSNQTNVYFPKIPSKCDDLYPTLTVNLKFEFEIYMTMNGTI